MKSSEVLKFYGEISIIVDSIAAAKCLWMHSQLIKIGHHWNYMNR